MEEMWQEAATRFEKRVGNPLNLEPAKTFEDCKEEIEKIQDPTTLHSSENGSKPSEFSKKGLQALELIKLLGGVAAEAASTIFPPSKLCFNALSLLLRIPSELHEFHRAIDGLLETISSSLSMFKIYETMDQFKNISEPLKQAAQQIMICFVDICGLSIQLRNTGGWKKAKRNLKRVLLDDDGGLKDEIDRFKKLTQAHSKIQATQTLGSVLKNDEKLTRLLSEAETEAQATWEWRANLDDKFDQANATAEITLSTVSSLKDSDNKNKTLLAHKSNLENIKTKLGLKESTISISKDTCDELHEVSVPNTADWLRNSTSFQDWADRDSHAGCLFVVSGDQNTGKSVIMATVSKYLKASHQSSSSFPGTRSRTLVGDYFFPGLIGKNEDKGMVKTALKCIMFQFASQSELYAKTLSQKCNTLIKDQPDYFKNSTCKDLWTLGLSDPREDFVHFILIDGLGGLPDSSKDQQNELFKVLSEFESQKSNVRVLISSRPDQNFTGGLVRLHVIDHSSPDILAYIGNWLRNKQLFLSTDETSQRIKNKLQQDIAAISKGSYNTVKSILEKVASIVLKDGTEEDINQALLEFNTDEESISQSTITELEATLTTVEAKELIELLTWVYYGYEWFTIDQLETALYIHLQRRSLLGLHKKLVGKYSRILSVSSEGFVQLNDNVSWDHINSEKREEPKASVSETMFSAEISIKNADKTSIQTFLWSLSRRINHDDFGFLKLTQQSDIKIRVNEINAHLSIIKVTYTILIGNIPDEKTQALVKYLLAYLPEHLRPLVEARNRDELDRSEKTMISHVVFKAVCSGEFMQQCWDAYEQVYWFDDPGALAVFLAWCGDRAAIHNLEDAQKNIVQEITKDKAPERALLSPVMKEIAWKWLSDSQWNALKLFRWLSGYLSLSGPERSGNDEDMMAPTSVPELASVARVEEWCANVLPDGSKDALWHKRVGQTYRDVGEYRLGIKSFQAALDLSPADPDCLEGCARCFYSVGEYVSACDKLKKAVQALEDIEHPNAQDHSTNWTIDLARWYRYDLRQADQAIDLLRQATTKAPDVPQLHFELLNLYITNSCDEDARKTLHDLFDHKEKGDNHLVNEFLNYLLSDNDNHGKFIKCLCLLRGHTEVLENIVEGLKTAAKEAAATSEKAENTDGMDKCRALGLYEGLVMYYFIDHGDKSRAVTCWERCLELDSKGQWSSFRVEAARLICAHHFNLAINSEALEHKENHIENMKAIINKDTSAASITAGDCYLASYIALDNPREARTVLQRTFDHASVILSDNIDENDSLGFFLLMQALLCTGDEANARIAQSVLIPDTEAGNMLSWLLQFDDESTQNIAAELIRTTLEEYRGFDLKCQLEFALDLVEQRLASEFKRIITDGDKGTGELSEHLPDPPLIGQLNGKLESGQNTPLQDLITTGQTTVDLTESTSQGPIEHLDTPTKQAYEDIHGSLRAWLSYRTHIGWQDMCDGCGNRRKLEDAWNFCKFCYNTAFCDSCLDQLKAEKLLTRAMNGLTCESNHGWLKRPKWEKDNFIESLKGNVIIPNQESAEARWVPIENWLSSMKEAWRISDGETKLPAVQSE